jgi:hypothetical protein
VPTDLGAEAEDGEHGKATVLDLLGLQVLEGGLSLAQVEQVEECTACNGQPDSQFLLPYMTIDQPSLLGGSGQCKVLRSVWAH